MEIFKEKRLIVGVGVLFIIISIVNSIGLSYLLLNKKNNQKTETNILAKLEPEQVKEDLEEFYVEVKGEVKKPGVFKVKDGTIINEVIKKAGGLTKNAYTKNINLSKRLSSELVVYIYNKNEFKTKKNNNNITSTKPCTTNTHEIDICIEKKASIIESTNSQDNQNTPKNESNNDNENKSNTVINDSVKTEDTSKININTADIATLSTLTGIGEKKAQAIIEYRNTNGSFKTIDEIKNISGIGEATFAKFKDNITV